MAENNLLELVLSAPVASLPCPGGCDHSEAERYAFDAGVGAGERGESDEACCGLMGAGMTGETMANRARRG